jgi:hypothetical protein
MQTMYFNTDLKLKVTHRISVGPGGGGGVQVRHILGEFLSQLPLLTVRQITGQDLNKKSDNFFQYHSEPQCHLTQHGIGNN